MGGQACVFYGAAEFSRDTDFAILADPANLARLRKALDELRAGVIAVPPFELKYLRHGQAIHSHAVAPDRTCQVTHESVPEGYSGEVAPRSRHRGRCPGVGTGVA
jgi:hypothetical protein